MKQISGGVTAAQGFKATGLAVGIKKKSEKKKNLKIKEK